VYRKIERLRDIKRTASPATSNSLFLINKQPALSHSFAQQAYNFRSFNFSHSFSTFLTSNTAKMRFNITAVFLATLVGTGLAAPLASRSLVGDVGNLLGGITQGVVVDVVLLETQLVSLLGPIVQTVNRSR
jgi:hypothetical protein